LIILKYNFLHPNYYSPNTYILIFGIFLLAAGRNPAYGQFKPKQDDFNKQSIYLEFGGNGRSVLCLNYERLFPSPVSYLHYTARIGVGFSSRNFDSSGIVNVPLEATVLLGRRKHFLEAGVGYTASFQNSNTDTTITPHLHYNSLSGIYCFRLGYRFALTDGVLFRFAPSLQLEQNPVWKVDLSWGVSIGVSFTAFREIWD
jgi:hypothetical protein